MPGSTFELVIEEERRDDRSAALPVRLSVNAAHALMNILRVFCYGLRRQRKRLRDHRQGQAGGTARLGGGLFAGKRDVDKARADMGISESGYVQRLV